MDWIALIPVGFVLWMWGGDILDFLTEVEPRTLYGIAAIIAAVGVVAALVMLAGQS